MTEKLTLRSSLPPRRLVVVADDFGGSSAINRAVALAHDRGILTAASIMVGGEAFDEAIEAASSRPGLSVGLHVTLCDGRAVLPHSRIPDLTAPDGRLPPGPVRAGLHYWRLRRRILRQLEAEIDAQIERLLVAGIRPHHVDGHHHLHVHPVLFRIVCRRAALIGVSWIRVPSEELRGAFSFDSLPRFPGHVSSWGAFEVLRSRNARTAAEFGLRSADRVYGLFRSGRVDEPYLGALIPRMQGLIIEVYTHPDESTQNGRKELAALLSSKVKEKLSAHQLLLTNYEELALGMNSRAGGSSQ